MGTQIRIAFALSVLASVSASAASQDAIAPRQMAQVSSAPVPPQAAQLPSDLFIRNAIAITQSLDAGGAAQIYDTASTAMKGAVSKETFVKAVAATNARTGRIAQREWGRVERLGVAAPAAGAAAPAVPVGNYVTVFLVARNAQGATHMEQVSFRLDEDNQWRLTGVTTQTPEQNRR